MKHKAAHHAKVKHHLHKAKHHSEKAAKHSEHAHKALLSLKQGRKVHKLSK